MTDFIGVKIALINNDQLLMIQRDDKPDLRYAGLWDFPGERERTTKRQRSVLFVK